MRAAPQTACMLKSCTAGKGLKTGEVERLLGLCSAISDYRLLFQLKFWVGRGAYNHSALWVIVGLFLREILFFTFECNKGSVFFTLKTLNT